VIRIIPVVNAMAAGTPIKNVKYPPAPFPASTTIVVINPPTPTTMRKELKNLFLGTLNTATSLGMLVTVPVFIL
jgi:hypothetical protein